MGIKNIVLIHGWGASVEKLMALKANLQKLGWSVYLPELPGFDAKAPKTPWKLNDYVSFVYKEANSIFKNGYFVFGHSFGGRVAIRMATQELKQVRGIILCAAGGITRSAGIRRLFFLVLAKVGRLFMVIPPLASAFKDLLYKLAREKDYYKTSGVMRVTFRNIVGEPVGGEVSAISKPTLVLWGKMDKMTPLADAYKLIGKLKKKLVKSVFFDKYGHTLPYDNSLQVAQEIDTWYKLLT